MLKAALLRMTSEFSPAVLMSGQNYHSHGHVLSIRLSDGLLRARVKGSSGQIYNVHIDLKTWPKSGSRCNCKYQVKCKHAAACFFALQAKENLEVVKPMPASQFGVLRSQDMMSPNLDEVISADDFTWYSEYEERGHDFFAYQLGILVDGKPISIVPLVVNLLRRIDSKTIETMPDNKLMHLPIERNKWLQIELGRIKPLLRLLLHYGLREGNDDTDIQMRRYQLALMQEAEQALRATKSRWHGTEDMRIKLQQLGAISTLPVIEPPVGLQTQLRDYQHQGLNWLQFLKDNGFSGILADDMGLGKTVQTLAHLQYEKERGHLQQASLIVAPTSLVGNWYEEAKRFTPDLKVLVFHGFDRHQGEFDGYDLVISTYGLVQRDKLRFLSYPFYYLILDEAQFIKNARTKTTQIMQQLQAKHRLCLTGTPLENHLGELWSLFHFLMPGLLGDAKQFRQFFRIPIEKHGDKDKKMILNGRIQSFMLRRTKNQVMRELPPKTEMTRMIELTGTQRDLYEAIRMTMEKKVRDAIAQQGLGRSQIVLLDALLKLRQVCCDPRLLSLPEASMAHDHSVKLDTLMELLDSLVEEGRRVLVFSQFTSMLKLIEEVLIQRNYAYFKLTGQTQNRQDLVNRFQAGEVPIFLISLKAGGTGLNLTRADTVILYDPWWNPAVQDQAAGRSHRIGQENPVFIYKLITAGSVEEAILDIQAKKRDLFEGILNNQMTHQFGLTDGDIDQFFTPLS
ncbi:MAG: DEAD/DEAH box helicase [Legionellaceae bacterium]|nr:DEAD/DEAH box helicase [Legionellaceae bacterium]